MMRLFKTIYSLCSKDGDLSKKNMKRYLALLLKETPTHSNSEFRQPLRQEWWHRFEGPILMHGTGEGHYTEIAKNLATKIEISVI